MKTDSFYMALVGPRDLTPFSPRFVAGFRKREREKTADGNEMKFSRPVDSRSFYLALHHVYPKKRCLPLRESRAKKQQSKKKLEDNCMPLI